MLLVLCWLCVLQIIFPACSLSFHCLNNVFYTAEVLGFDEDRFISFSPSGFGGGVFVCVKSKNSLISHSVWSFYIFPKSFKVLFYL